MKREYSPEQVINGTWGESWLDGDYLANVTALKAEINIKTTQIARVQSLVDGEKLTGLEYKGELKFHKVNSYVLKKYVKALREGRMPKCDIISNLKDPDALGAERVALYGCTFDKAILADWEAGKNLEESYSFTFQDYELLDTID